MWIGPLATETIEDMVMWSTKSQDLDVALADVVEAASLEAWAHGPTYFDKWTKAVKEAVSNTDQSYSGLSSREAQTLWVNFLTGSASPVGYKLQTLLKTLK
jgi:hypothetical protein